MHVDAPYFIILLVMFGGVLHSMVNFYQSILVNVYMANNAPYFILLCLMPHDFTQKGENK
jgi:hypothetical protein